MQFEDTGIILSAKKFSDSGLLLCIFSENHGLIKGICKGQKKNLSNAQQGNLVNFTWRGRLEEHLGTLNIELEKAYPLLHFANYTKIMAISSTCSLLEAILQEKEPMQEFYYDIIGFLEGLRDNNWLKNYAFFELNYLTKNGFGFDFSRCSVSELTNAEELHYISPKTGAVVSREVGEPYKDKLFTIPKFFKNNNYEPEIQEILEALKLTRFFIIKNYFEEGLAKFPQNAINFFEDIIKNNNGKERRKAEGI